MDFKNGTIIVDGEAFGPKYSFERFKKSPFYKNQDGIRFIHLDGKKDIQGRKYIVTLFFRNDIIYMISLVCCDFNFTPENEKERKNVHDQILNAYAINNEKKFHWGKITSEYDQRSNLSSINIIYN